MKKRKEIKHIGQCLIDQILARIFPKKEIHKCLNLGDYNFPQLYIYIKFNIMNYITRATSNFRGTQPFLGKVFLGISGLTAVLGAWSYVQSKTVESEIAFRKKQLAKPIYKLS